MKKERPVRRVCVECPVCGKRVRSRQLQYALKVLAEHMVAAHPGGPIGRDYGAHDMRLNNQGFYIRTKSGCLRSCCCGFTEGSGQSIGSHLQAYYPNLGGHFARHLLEKHA